MNQIEDILSNYGFRMIGNWIFDTHYKSVSSMAHLPSINFIIPQQSDRNVKEVTYIFLFNSEFGYIGSTGQCIKDRLSQYRYGFNDKSKIDKGKNDTDNRVKEGITYYLQQGYKISILTATPKANLSFKDGTKITVPAYEPLEKYLISTYNPMINRTK